MDWFEIAKVSILVEKSERFAKINASLWQRLFQNFSRGGLPPLFFGYFGYFVFVIPRPEPFKVNL